MLLKDPHAYRNPFPRSGLSGGGKTATKTPLRCLVPMLRKQSNGSVGWVIRAYLPDAEAAWVIHPEDRQEYPMQSVHHPHFFECEMPGDGRQKTT